VNGLKLYGPARAGDKGQYAQPAYAAEHSLPRGHLPVSQSLNQGFLPQQL
jgi:hypothetical protein